MSEEIESHIYKKFEILQKLGKGAYGVVWKAIEKSTKKVVALKKVFEAFHNSTDAQRTFREVIILQELCDHENIVKLKNVIKADNNKDIYLVFEFMETDLHAVIKAGILKKIHKQYIIYQLLKGIKYIQSGDIIHRDLKPSNLLINSECLVKIADFGLARSIKQDDDKDAIMTEYVATRWYRAPEIVLGSNKYSKAVDMWSVGCILAELINGKAIFPGKSSLNQIELILEVIGKPSFQDIRMIESESALQIINSISIKNKKSFEQNFLDQDPDTLNFLKRCLEFNPAKRITVDQALEHQFVKNFHDPAEEKVLGRAVKIPIDDNNKLSLEKYREALYNDIIQKKREQKALWRQKYLNQLGIDVKDSNVSQELMRNILAKKSIPKKTLQNKKSEKSSSKNKPEKVDQKLQSSKQMKDPKIQSGNLAQYKKKSRKVPSKELQKKPSEKSNGITSYFKKPTNSTQKFGTFVYSNPKGNFQNVMTQYKKNLTSGKPHKQFKRIIKSFLV